MIYNIPKWPDDSDLKHTATTWVLARDKDFENVEEEVDESEDYLIAWEVDKIIPTGDVWFIKALRKLEDSDGNDVGNDKWIGPKPVISHMSNLNDYLAPRFYISTPYISDIEYKDSDYLKIKLNPYKTNVGYKSTLLNIEDVMGEVLFTKFYNMDDDENEIKISNDELDFSELDDIQISIIHCGTRSTTSRPVVEVINLRNSYFKLVGNTKNLDPTYNNIISLKSTTDNDISIKKAVLKNRAGDEIEDCVISDNDVTISKGLDFNKEFLLYLTVDYIDGDGNTQTTYPIYVLTTRDDDEVMFTNSYREYVKDFSKVKDIPADDAKVKYDVSINFNTEELFTYSTPIPDKDTNKISLFGLDKNEYAFSKHLENVIDKDSDFFIRLITKTKGIIQTSDNGEVVITPFTFDPYVDGFVLKDDIKPGLKSDANFINRLSQQPNGVFIMGINKDDDKKLLVKELNMDDLSISDKLEFDLPDSCTDVAISALDDVLVLIAPKGENVDRFFIYSATDNYINSSVNIPDDFVNKNLLMNRLYNGDVIMFKHNDSDNALDYAIYYSKDNSTEVISTDTGSDTKAVTNLIALKNGNVLTLVYNDENDDDDEIEFWLFK